jgi:hypothetical protein
MARTRASTHGRSGRTGDRSERSGDDRQRQADPEQPRRHANLAPERAEVDARRVGEENERERGLRENTDAFALDLEVEPAEHFRPGNEAGGDEDHRGRDHRSLEAARQTGVADHGRRHDSQAPGIHGLA